MTQHSVAMNVITKSDAGWDAAFNLFTKVAMDYGDNFAHISVSSTELDFQDEVEEGVEPAEEFFDDGTMKKVFEAIRRGLTDTATRVNVDDVVTDIVTSLQNAGIKFREIRN